MPGPLRDIRVLDFSTLLPGPMATLFLAEAGAEVIKVERPGRGEEMRSYTPKWGRDSGNFHMLNRGKKSIALDLKDPAQRDRILGLVKSSDIIVEQFRPGVMDRLGLGYDAVRKINPDIIYCAITGYGQKGPKAMRAGHDLNYIGDAGLLALSSGTVQAPVIPPALIADIAGGTYPAVLNILLALRERDMDGTSAYLDISMADNLFPFMYWAMADGQVADQWPGNGDALVTGGSCRYRLYATQDARFLAAAPLEQKFWEAFCEAIDLPPDLRNDTVDPSATEQAVERIIAAKPATHWQDVFEAADCCCSIVATVQDALRDPHFNARGVFAHKLSGADGATIAALPTPIARAFAADSKTARFAPALGADNDLLTDVAP